MVAGDSGWRWGTGVSLTLTGLNSLASNDGLTDGSVAFWESALLDFSALDNVIDVLFTVQLKSGSAVANDKAAYVYAWGGTDDGAGTFLYTDAIAANGPAARSAGKAPSAMKQIGTVPLPTAATTYVGGPFSYAQAFGGKMPAKGGIAIRQYTGNALDGTVGNFKITYQPIYAATELS